MTTTTLYEPLTRSKRIDGLLFAAILSLSLIWSRRLPVYFRVVVVEVTVERITPAGDRKQLPTPKEFQRFGNGLGGAKSLSTSLAPRIHAYMTASPWARDAPAGTRFEWTARWSINSLRLDRVERIPWEVPSDLRQR